MPPLSPYLAPGFYTKALAEGRHRAIVGGRWEETGRVQMAALRAVGLLPHHHLLDIGAGALRLGCKAVPYLDPGHYWATDAARALMLAGHRAELDDPGRLDPSHLLEDPDFGFAGLPETITHAIAFAVFPHLPMAFWAGALERLHRFSRLERFLFTVFLAPEAAMNAPFRQADGVVTHPARPPYHVSEPALQDLAAATGWALERQDRLLPRGQVMFVASPTAGREPRAAG